MRQTIAFNNGGDFWSTRLSYVPSIMAWIKQHHISCPQAGVTPFWKHDESTSTNNQFYGEEAVSSIVAISFNDNPSTNKIYKALSVESPDINEIQGGNVFIPNAGTGNATLKSVAVSSLKNKGGILYGGMSGEQRKTIANIQYLGTVVGGRDVTVPGAETSVFLNILDGGGDNSWTGQEAFLTDVPDSFNPEESSRIGGVFEKGFFSEPSVEFQPGTQVFLVYVNSNGDQARGQFADCIIGFGAGDFEVYSINVDYEPTELDHDS